MRWWIVWVLGAAACGEGLDNYSDVHDLRVLAIQARDPEILLDKPDINAALTGGAGTTHAMHFTALVVDPRGGAINYRWSLCPIESSSACLDYEVVRDSSPEYATALDDLRAQSALGTAVPLDTLTNPSSARGVSPYDMAPFDLPAVSSDLYKYHLFTSFLGFGLGSWPQAVLEITKGDESLLASKRVVLGIEDPAAFVAPFADRFGITLCTAPNEPAGCIQFDTRTPNLNPEFAGVDIAQGERSDAAFSPIPIDLVDRVAGPLPVRTGSATRIRPSFTPESFQSYQLFKADLETNTISVDNQTEEISVSWFTSAGSVADQMTWPKFTKTLDTIYRAPDRAPDNGNVTVWMVARDQRGGTSWLAVELVVGAF